MQFILLLVHFEDHLQSKVKQEAYNENLGRDFEKEYNNSSVQLSEDKRESEQNDGSSQEKFVEEIGQVPNEKLIQNLYPKWIIEVEKKRADADLHRAKAEEQTAAAAAKNAESAVLQAKHQINWPSQLRNKPMQL